MGECCIDLRYYTEWSPAGVHFSSFRGDKSASWESEEMQTSAVDGWREVELKIPSDSDGIEFVFFGPHGALWDNAPQPNEFGRSNYLVKTSGLHNVLVVVADGSAAVISSEMRTNGKLLVVTDLDGTLIGRDDYLEVFLRHWRLRHQWRGSKLVYNTGRNLKDFLAAAGENSLPRPDYAVLGVGTEIYTFPGYSSKSNSHIYELLSDEELKNYSDDISYRQDNWPKWCPTRFHARFDSYWLNLMKRQFDRKGAEAFVLAELQNVYINGNIFHDPLRLSVSIPFEHLNACLADPDSSFLKTIRHNYKICISGGGEWRYLDILPKQGGKLSATKYVMKELEFEPKKTMVCGDSGNDIDMFAQPDVLGVCVSNAQLELVHFLRQDEAQCFQRNNGQVNGVNDPVTSCDGPQKDEVPFHLEGLVPTENVCFAKHPCAGGILEGLRFFGFDGEIGGF